VVHHVAVCRRLPTFIDDTAARGYNAIEFHVVSHEPARKPPAVLWHRDAPFLKRLDGGTWSGALNYGNINTEAPDFTTPNPNYWSHVDGLLAYADPKASWLSCFRPMWVTTAATRATLQELVANGSTKMQSYGTWIATRYKNQKNLVWMMGGDMGTAPHAFQCGADRRETGLLNGLKSVSGQQSIYFSAEWDSESIGTDQTSFGSSMTLNSTYSWTGKGGLPWSSRLRLRFGAGIPARRAV